jgi:hypothetical protein
MKVNLEIHGHVIHDMEQRCFMPRSSPIVRPDCIWIGGTRNRSVHRRCLAELILIAESAAEDLMRPQFFLTFGAMFVAVR